MPSRGCIAISALLAATAAIILLLYLTFNNNKRLSMDTTEANWAANRTVPIHWIDVYCPTDIGIVSDESISVDFDQSNAILMRSGAPFKIQLATRRYIFKDDCVIEPHETLQYLDIRATVRDLVKETEGFIVISATITTAGGFARYSDLAFVDKRYVGTPQKTLIHELGHVWQLSHPFEMKESLPDLPKGCATPSERSDQLYLCPSKIRTCPGSTEDEKLDNVMDYLPLYCGVKYRFTPSQIDIIDKTSRVSILPLLKL